MFKIILIFSLFFTSIYSATNFSGNWKVYKVENITPFYGEIVYPKYLEIRSRKSGLTGKYTNQYGYSCNFSLIKTINANNELILAPCGTTKYSTSWNPIYKVKRVKDRLIGIVITNRALFKWYAKKNRIKGKK